MLHCKHLLVFTTRLPLRATTTHTANYAPVANNAFCISLLDVYKTIIEIFNEDPPPSLFNLNNMVYMTFRIVTTYYLMFGVPGITPIASNENVVYAT